MLKAHGICKCRPSSAKYERKLFSRACVYVKDGLYSVKLLILVEQFREHLYFYKLCKDALAVCPGAYWNSAKLVSSGLVWSLL